jgi:GH25 family lysozyme M1 (1,4-beta-N-acetylmuramidase)
MGFHAGAPCNGCNGIGGMWDALEAAGVPFGVYSVNGGGLAAEGAQHSLATVIYRDVAYDYVPYQVIPTAASATGYWAQMAAALPPEVRAAKDRVWIEVFNEPDKERPEIVAQWQYYLARAAIADGYRFCGPGWASGTPEPAAWRGEWMQRYLRLCAAEPERVAVTLHEYSYEAADIKAGYPYLVGRYRFLFEACDALGIARPTVFITESGWTLNDMPSHTEDAMRDVAVLAQEYAPHPEIKAAFLWTLIGGGDKKQLAQRLNGLISPVTDYALTTRFDETPAPTPQPSPTPPPSPAPTPVPAVNLLPNGDFAGGWKDSEKWPMTTQDPTGWLALWNASDGDDYRNEYAPEQPYRIGEAIHKGRAHVPAAEHSDFFAGDNAWTYKVFAAARPFWFRLKTDPALTLPAGRYALSFQVFTDTYHWEGEKVYQRIEPHHTQVLVKVGGRTVRDWTPLAAGRDHTVTTEFDYAGGALELVVQLRCNWGIASNNLWLKRLQLTAVTVRPEPEPDPEPPLQNIVILDISKWQGQIDPAKMKAAGVDAVILRASYSTSTGTKDDELAEEYAAQLRAASIPIAALYHYFHPARPWGEQYDRLAAMMRELGVRRGALDLEENRDMDASVSAKAQAFMEALDRGFPLPEGEGHLVYTSLGYWRDKMGSPAWGSRYGLWIAAWTTAAQPAVPAPWSRWTLWQYTSKGDGKAHGVSSVGLDMNRWRTGWADFQAWCAAAVTSTEPTEPLANALWARGAAEPTLTWNPAFALAGAILNDGYHVISQEFDVAHHGATYKCQNAADDVGARRVYYCAVPKWSEVKWIAGPSTTPPTTPPPAPAPAPTAPTPTPPKVLVNLARAFRPVEPTAGAARGPFMVYAHDDGRTEDAQYLVRGADVFLIKGSNYERFQVRATGNRTGVYRFEDTSHGDDTYYELRDTAAVAGSLWLPLEMEIGRVFRRAPQVTFYRKADCKRYDGPRVHVTWAMIDKLLARATLPGGLEARNVIDLYVAGSSGDVKGRWFEHYWYALGTPEGDGRTEVRGLVQWWARDAAGQIVAHSWLADLPQGRAPLPLMRPGCLGGGQ